MTPIVQKFRLSDLEAWEQNPRRISAEALEGLKESIATFGAIDMPVVNVRDGKKRLVSGHQRVRAMIDSGVTDADCLAVDLDDATEMAANLTLNNPHIQGTFDVAKASPMIDALSNDFKRAGFTSLQTELTRQVARMEAPKPKAQNAVSEAVTEGRKTANSVKGKIYALGKHRLYCGPFQEAAPKFFGAKGSRKADACITDPPYNVAYSGVAGEVFNDSMSDADWLEFMNATCKAILDNTNGPCYAFMSTKELDTLHKAFKTQGAVGLRTLWWVKDRPTINPMRAASLAGYSWQHEPLVRCHRSGLGEFPLKQPRTSVFKCPRSHKNPFHPTSKPIALVRDIMEGCTDPGDLVWDPFVGGGTTLLVAEELNRICYASELDPWYCDQVRRRYVAQVHGEAADFRELSPVTKG
jgi:DNA modification methylase